MRKWSDIRPSKFTISSRSDRMYCSPTPELSSIVKEDVNNIIAKCGGEIGSLDGSTVLITGSTGFLAREITESLLRSKANGLDIKMVLTSRKPSKVHEVFGDRLGAGIDIIPIDEMDRYPDHVDHIIHAASPCDPRLNNASPFKTMLEISSMTQKAIMLGMRNDLKRFVLLSSGAVYGIQPPELRCISEDHTGAPDIRQAASCYGEAKRYSELILLASGLPYTILRGFSFIGPNQDLSSSFAVPDFINSGFKEHRIVINGDGRPVRSFCYESDFAVMLLKSLVHAKNQTLNAGNDRPEISIMELANIIADRIGGVKVLINGATTSEGLPPRYVPNIDRMRGIFVPEVDIGAGIDRIVKHIRETRSNDLL